MNELVSIIMPSYNTERFITESIQSVIDQTYTAWELIIVDDCSTDNTDKMVETFNDSRIKYLKNEKNCGAAISRNRALAEAKGRWIAFLDSDDYWYPEKLEQQVSFMLEKNYYFSYTMYEEMNEAGEKTGIVVTGPKKITKAKMYDYCWPGCLTVMYDAERVGLIQVANIKKNNDYAMWLKVCKKADCYLLPKVLATYRRGRKGSVSSHGVLTMIGWHYALFRKSEGQTSLVALFNTIRNVLFGFWKKILYYSRNTMNKKHFSI